MEVKPRKLKIQSRFRTRTYDNTTIPEIRLQGRWLEKLGFEKGMQVVVKQTANKLVITLI
jgi:toxic protein SymE